MSELNHDANGGMTTEEMLALERQRADALEAELAPFRAFKARMEMSLRANVTAGNISDEVLAENKDVFPIYQVGIALKVGDIFRTADGKLYKTIQAHTTQADWVPGPSTLALYNVVETTAGGDPVDPDNPPDEPLPWQAGVAYKVGDARIHDGIVYDCIQAHTSQVGWEPPAVASLWKKR